MSDNEEQISAIKSGYDSVVAAAQQLEGLEPNTAAYDAAASQLSSAASQLQSSISSLAESAPDEIKIKVNSNADSVKRTIDSIKSKTITITVKQSGSVNTGDSNVQINAKGTSNASAGLSLVDEEGAELIEHISEGTYELGTNNGARLTTLNKGDVVHTAKETKKILSRNGIFKKIGNAFRNGLNNAKSIVGKAFASGSTSVGSIKIELFEGGTATKTGKTSASSSVKSWKKDLERLFDWVERRIGQMSTYINQTLAEVENKIGYVSKNSGLDTALEVNKQLIKTNTEALDMYMNQAYEIFQATGLWEGAWNAILFGDIDIAQYSKDTQEKIKAVQQYVDKAISAQIAAEEAITKQRQLAAQELDTIISEYEHVADAMGLVVDRSEEMRSLKGAQGIEIVAQDYDDAIEYTIQQIDNLIEEKNVLEREFNRLVTEGYIPEESEEWYEYRQQIDELGVSILEMQGSLEDLYDEVDNIPITNLTYQLDALAEAANRVSESMDLHAAQLADETADSYQLLILNGMDQIKNLEQQNALYREQQKGLDVLSEKYQELEQHIVDNISAISEMKVSQEEWNDAIIDLEIKKINDYKEELSKVNDQYDRQRQLQEAIQDLERARTQRNQRVYTDQGFVYQADQQALRDATDNLEDIVEDQLIGKLDDLIDALEDFKADTSVYDSEGRLLGTEYSLPSIDLSELLADAGSNIVPDAIKGIKEAAYQSVLAGATASTLNLSMGDIIVQEADDGNALAQSVIEQFPNALLRAIYNKN